MLLLLSCFPSSSAGSTFQAQAVSGVDGLATCHSYGIGNSLAICMTVFIYLSVSIVRKKKKSHVPIHCTTTHEDILMMPLSGPQRELLAPLKMKHLFMRVPSLLMRLRKDAGTQKPQIHFVTVLTGFNVRSRMLPNDVPVRKHDCSFVGPFCCSVGIVVSGHGVSVHTFSPVRSQLPFTEGDRRETCVFCAGVTGVHSTVLGRHRATTRLL